MQQHSADLKQVPRSSPSTLPRTGVASHHWVCLWYSHYAICLNTLSKAKNATSSWKSVVWTLVCYHFCDTMSQPNVIYLFVCIYSLSHNPILFALGTCARRGLSLCISFPQLGRDLQQYQSQAKQLFRKLNEQSPSRCTLEAGSMSFQWVWKSCSSHTASVVCQCKSEIGNQGRGAAWPEASIPPVWC